MLVSPNSLAIGKTLIDLQLPSGALIVLIHRNETVLVPRGSTQIELNDTLLVLADRDTLPKIKHAMGHR
jgi:cell volume regulation protein A